MLDKILKQPVFRKEMFSSPVIIETIELLRFENNFLCRVRSKDGAEGISVGHGVLRNLYPIFTNLVQPFFINKDARDLDLLLEKVYIYKLNFRLSGLALGVPLATIELAILDMMGRIAGKPIGQLIFSNQFKPFSLPNSLTPNIVVFTKTMKKINILFVECKINYHPDKQRTNPFTPIAFFAYRHINPPDICTLGIHS